MKKIIGKIKKGLVVYTTYMLESKNKLSINQLKKEPKEAMLCFSEIVSVSTTGLPENWIKIVTLHEDKIYYEQRSITNFIKIVGDSSNFIFQKINNGLAININHLKHKSNLTLVELINGDIYRVNPRYKKKLKEAILKIWER